MTLDQFTEQLDLLGSDLRSWPEQQRQQAEALLAGSADAAKLLRAQAQADALLAELPMPGFAGLALRVASQALPERPLLLPDRLLNWIIPDTGIAGLWRPATAACLPLLFGVVMGNYFNFGINSDIQASDYLEDELAMISLTDYSENQVEL